MKNILRVIVAILIVVITFLITYKLIPYSQKDINRIQDIYLGRKKATLLDYLRLDVNNDKVIDIFDGAIIVKNIGE
jgi:signal transduction histidine kinase